MAITRWTPPEELSRQEEMLLKRLDRVRKLLGFLRLQRRVLFNDEFQAELESMYRDTGAGRDPVPPALMSGATSSKSSLSTCWTSEITTASSWPWDRSISPLARVRLTMRSASTRDPTTADRMSLSPNRISSVATESFSFTTGRMPALRRVESVFRAFK